MSCMLRKVAVVAVSSGVLAIGPVAIGSLPFGLSAGAAAFAQGNGNGNGGGHGGGHGNGGSAGNSGSAHGMGAAMSASHGHSEDAGSTQGIGGFVSGLFGIERHGRAGQQGRGHSSRASAGHAYRSLARQQEAALRGKNVPVPTEVAVVDGKNLHARLGWLNSLQRNYHAYLNAKDPKFAPFQSYVLTSARTEVDLDKAKTELASAVRAYAALSAYDSVTVDPNNINAVESRIADLDKVDTSQLSASQLDAYDAELGTLNAIVTASDEITADEQTLSSQKTAEEAALGTATGSTRSIRR